MQRSLFVRAACFALMCVSLTARADLYKIGDSFVSFTAPDQHGTNVTFKAGDAKFILFDTPGESGESVALKDPGWFTKNRALLLVNISELSSFKARIARSRMAAKPFRLLVVAEKSVAEKFPQTKGKFSVLVLDDKGAITSIKFAAPGQELQALVTEGKP
jgi:peroxiredoxin